MPIIYLFATTWSSKCGDVVGYAVAEDGHCLAQHLSSSINFAKHDMGLNSTWKHELYYKHYPDGFELKWVDKYEDVPEGIRERNRKLADMEET